VVAIFRREAGQCENLRGDGVNEGGQDMWRQALR
jgi:hypothetical protein